MPQRRLFIKMVFIAGLLIALAIGLTFVNVLVYERESYQEKVIGDIAHHQIGNQTIISPFISVPYTFVQPCDGEANPSLKGKSCTYTYSELIFPSNSTWHADFDVTNQEYQRTIYSAISYTTQLKQQASFDNPQITARDYQWENAKFILPIKDLRGLKNKPVLTVGQTKYSLDFPKNSHQTDFNYVEVALPHLEIKNFSYQLDLSLEGLQSFALVPTHENLRYSAQGNWGDAKFMGNSLPIQNQSAPKNFTASWQNLTLGYQNQQRLNHCWNYNSDCKQSFGFNLSYYADQRHYADNQSEGFAVEFIEPINIYSQTDRAIKYGWMITLITFGCFFLFEMLKGLRIHPVQYGLVGTAQAIFFILLLSLSEQISFVIAYSIASVACIGLISWYLSFVLKNWRSTALFSVLIGTLYGVMYLLLQSAEKTFLLGSLFSFFVVAVVMYLTRHIDWYDLGNDHLNQDAQKLEAPHADKQLD